MAKFGVIVMSVITAAVAVTSCGQGERSLFSDATVKPAVAAGDPQSAQADREARPPEPSQPQATPAEGR